MYNVKNFFFDCSNTKTLNLNVANHTYNKYTTIHFIMASSRNKIFLYISDVASFIGQNHWDYVLPFERLWKRVDNTGYTQALCFAQKQMELKQRELLDLEQERVAVNDDLACKRITQRQHALTMKRLANTQKQIQQHVENIQDKVDDIDLTQQQKLEKAIGKETVEKIADATIETKDKRETVGGILDTLDVSDRQLENLKKHAESFINKSHGTIKEDTAIGMYESKYKVKLDTSQQFFKYNLESCSQNSCYNWFICGKMDGIYKDDLQPDSNYVVEVKNRTRGFFSTLRDYEKTQIQLYLLLTGFKQAKLVERYESNLRVTQIFRDNDYINSVIEYLTIFIHNFETRFLDDEKAKQDFVLLDPEAKRGFLKRLYINQITNRINQKLEAEYAESDSDTDQDDCMIDTDSL
ncbi:MAG: hypothetical protein EBU90_04365 [Proteobacteria bacterium]|nr:hypothetical protein [Pseudomonadota bacterium]NBP15219.1 hypothetical protein [bacterium]